MKYMVEVTRNKAYRSCDSLVSSNCCVLLQWRFSRFVIQLLSAVVCFRGFLTSVSSPGGEMLLSWVSGLLIDLSSRKPSTSPLCWVSVCFGSSSCCNDEDFCVNDQTDISVDSWNHHELNHQFRFVRMFQKQPCEPNPWHYHHHHHVSQMRFMRRSLLPPQFDLFITLVEVHPGSRTFVDYLCTSL